MFEGKITTKQGTAREKHDRRQYPTTSLIIAGYNDLLLLHSERTRLELWLFTLKNTGVETVLTESV